MRLDKLNEISKAAAIKASSALSKLIQQPVGVDISPSSILDAKDFSKRINNYGEVVSIISQVSGELKGVSLMMFPNKTALFLCDILLNRKTGTTEKFDEMEISALTEVANILFGNFLTPFAYPLKVESLMHHVPKFKNDSFERTFIYLNDFIDDNIQDKLWVEIMITLNYQSINGYLVFMLGKEEMKNVLEK
jgi:chemotaxis protein CheY-P-specific phosphatase CheC